MNQSAARLPKCPMIKWTNQQWVYPNVPWSNEPISSEFTQMSHDQMNQSAVSLPKCPMIKWTNQQRVYPNVPWSNEPISSEFTQMSYVLLTLLSCEKKEYFWLFSCIKKSTSVSNTACTSTVFPLAFFHPIIPSCNIRLLPCIISDFCKKQTRTRTVSLITNE